ncbi:MAG: hypothetical protein V7K47_12210 [Nostoc sp.]
MRAKFLAESVNNLASGNTIVNLAPVLKSSEENKSFWQATPNGKLEMCVTNPKAKEFFEAGKEYYLDFTPA